jgi:hypothetical protein
MTTTDLIELLKKYEKGACGRSREISITVKSKGRSKFIGSPEIKVDSTGTGVAGAEICLLFTTN